MFDFRQSSNNLTSYPCRLLLLIMHTLNQLFIIIDYAADYNVKYIPVDY